MIPGKITVIWDFFSKPGNLDRITPPDMGFEIVTDLGNSEMYPGLLIQYQIQPFPWFSTQWLTEITSMIKHKHFVDEQKMGPFAFWHHHHGFSTTPKGVLMVDTLHYAIPYGVLGSMVNRLIVADRIERIFAYRKATIESLFSPYRDGVPESITIDA